MANKTSALIVSLVLVIAVLSVAVLYAFVLGPAYTGFVVDRQTEGVERGVQVAVNNILEQVQQNGFVQIPLGEDEEGNAQVLYLAPFNPQQQQAQAQAQAPLA